MSYTDVDRLILDRWNEVVALRQAFDDLLKRMEHSIEQAVVRAERWVQAQGWQAENDVRQTRLDFWKPEWANRRGEAALCFRIADFAPREYSKSKDAHPWIWLFTEDMARFKMSESDRIRFARDVHSALGADARRWDHPDADEAKSPLGRYYADVTPDDRIRWMSHPDELTAFLTRGVEEAMTLAPAIDATLARFRKA